MSGDASEVYRLAADLSRASRSAVTPVRAVMKTAGDEFAKEWADNARGHISRGHARNYPDSIDAEMKFGISSIAVEVGPNEGKPQGFLGKILEDGGSHNAPQHNGLNALDRVGPRTDAAIEAAISRLLS